MLPYENATSGKSALDDMQKLLRGFGASSFGSMEDYEHGEVIVQFTHQERRVTIKASSRGYAAAWLKHHPYTHRTRATQRDHEVKARAIGQVAVYSILRDWIKGQVTAVEVGMLSFEGAFLGHILLSDGSTILDRVQQTNTLQIDAKGTP